MKRKSLRTILLAFMFSMLPMLLEAQQEKRPQPGTKLTDEQIKQWVAPMRAGRKLTPKSWPNGAKVAVCLSWDMDNETFEIAAGHSAPVLLSQGEYGFTEGLPRIMAMDEPYELLSNGRPTGMVELPVDWILDDYPYFVSSGSLPSPELIFKVYQDEFDGAYQEGTMFMLTLHPMVSGHRSRIAYLDKLIAYMKSKPGVWFATGRQIADYVRQNLK